MSTPPEVLDACRTLARHLTGVDGFTRVGVRPSGYVSALVRLDRILANRDDLAAVLASGRPSHTDAPILLNARDGEPCRFELADGHHRIATALRTRRSWACSLIDPCEDDEPLSGPFYTFPAPGRTRRCRGQQDAAPQRSATGHHVRPPIEAEEPATCATSTNTTRGES